MTEQNYDFYVSKIKSAVNKFYNPYKPGYLNFYNPKNNTITRCYDEYTVSLCTEGEGHYIIDEKEYFVKSGDVSFFNKNCTRTYRNVPGKTWKYITISFDMKYLTNNETVTINNIETFNKSVPYELQQIFYKFYDEWIGRSRGYKLKCRTMMQEIILRLIELNFQREYPQNHYIEIEKARKFIFDHVKNSIDFDKLITDSALSPTHFRRLFKKIVGYSPRDYYNYIKIKQSQDMLKTGMFTISEIANEMGYSSVYYFSATFKKYYNISPNNYIKGQKDSHIV